MICESTRFASSELFDRNLNNARPPGLSPRDIVEHFRALGFTISLADWRAGCNPPVPCPG